jgi:hypothetical protein
MTRGEEEQNFNGHLVHAIFAAKPDTVAGPVHYVGQWVIFVVRRVLPEPLPLAAVSAKIARRLRAHPPQRALQSFANTYQQEWRSRTHCQTGFVVPECSESPVQPQPEIRLLAR